MDLINSISIAVISAVVVSIVNYFILDKQKREEERRAAKINSYSSLLDNARAFLSDPNLSKDDRRKVKKDFLKKYYNEIILFADEKVRKSIENFIQTGGVSSVNNGDQLNRFRKMVSSIRRDLGSNSGLKDDFEMYSLDIGEERD
jgi:hypothetical protein